MTKQFFLAISLFIFQLTMQAKPLSASQKPNDSSAISPAVLTVKLSSGVKMEYTEQGNKQGPTIIFLHGFTDSWHSFEQTLRLFPRQMHAMAISQRGHGNSSKPKSGYHPKDFAADVAALIKIKNLGSCILVGHSMGGIIAQQFALDYPHLTRALVLVSSDACFVDNPGFPEFGNEIMALKGDVDYAFAEAFQKSTVSQQIDTSLLKLFTSESMKVPLHVWKSAMKELMSVNYTNRLQFITVPVLILWGNKDLICSLTDQEKMKQELGNATLLVYDDTGHALHWEEEQRFTANVVHFIKGLPQPHK